MRLLPALVLALLALPPALANADDDPILARQAMMKTNGRDTKVASAMLKGETPFDAGAAAVILADYRRAADQFGHYFTSPPPPGAKSEAAPAIWEKPDAWAAALARFKADADAAAATQPTSVETFKPAFLMVVRNCKSCHDAFRTEAKPAS